MKFAALILAALAAMGTASVIEVAAPETPALASDSKARNYCAPSKCPCPHVPNLFCGNETRSPHCTNGHVFECDGNTAALLSCDFGTMWACVKCGRTQCDSGPGN